MIQLQHSRTHLEETLIIKPIADILQGRKWRNDNKGGVVVRIFGSDRPI